MSVSSGEDGSDTVLKARILDRGVNVGVDEPIEREVSGMGNGPIAAFLNAVSNFGITASIMDYVEHTGVYHTTAAYAFYLFRSLDKVARRPYYVTKQNQGFLRYRSYILQFTLNQ